MTSQSQEQPELRTSSQDRKDRGSGFGQAISSLADVRSGEGRAVAGAALTLGGIVGSHICLETARDAIFLTTLPAKHLAFVYIALAVLAALVGRFEQGVTRALGRTNALILSLMLAAMGTTLFYVAEKGEALSFLLYLWTGLTGTLLTLQFWLFLAGRFSGAQGRRLYGLVAAGGVLGAVLGGSGAALFTQWFHVEGLLAVSASLQLLTALLVTSAPEARDHRIPSRLPKMGASLRRVMSVAYTRRIALLTAIATATLLCTDYLFKSVAVEHVPPEKLGSFFSTYYASMNALALIVQVFIAMRVLQRAGTIFALTLLPFALIITAAFPLALGGVFAGVLLTRGADGALRHSLHRVSTELLFLPLSSEDRAASKSLIDTLVVRGVQGLTALFLLALAALNHDGASELLGVIIGGAILWIIVALSLRNPYLKQFRDAIGRSNSPSELTLGQMTLDGVEVVIASLSSSNENRVLSAIRLFEEAGRTGLIPALLLYHPSEKVILRALEVIPSTTRTDWPDLTRRLLEHPSPEVQLASLKKLGHFNHLTDLNPDTYDDPRLRAAAAFFLSDTFVQPLDAPVIRDILQEETGSVAQKALVKTISEHGSARWADVLLSYAKNQTTESDPSLPAAMSRVRDSRFIPTLINRLSLREGRGDVRQALAAMGQEAFEALELALADSKTSNDVRLHIPRAISRFRSRKAALFLLEQLHADLPGAVRFKALRGLGRISSDLQMHFPKARVLPLVEKNAQQSLKTALFRNVFQPSEDPSSNAGQAAKLLLSDLLRAKQHQSLERMTRLLQLLHPHEDLRRVFLALREGDKASRSAAGELLEVITLGYDEGLREMIRALSDPHSLEQRSEYLRNFLGLDGLRELDALRYIFKQEDPIVSVVAIDYVQKRQILELAVEAEQALANNPWLSSGSAIEGQR